MNIDKRFIEMLKFAAGEATLAFSKLLAKPMVLKVMDIDVVNKDSINEIVQLYPVEKGTIIMTTTLIGMIDGIGVFILPIPSAVKLCGDLLNKKRGNTRKLSNLEQSALLEVGNIVIGCFLNALGYVSPLNNILHKKLSLRITPKNEQPDLDDLAPSKDERVLCTAFQVKSGDVEGLCVFFFNKSILKYGIESPAVENS